MAQPFGVGDVVGGRYRITHHVVTSADQDIVFQAHDQVLDREVSILLASRSNAKQVATSARELATGERDSDAHVLDLGLAEDRTYLISALVDPNHLLDLVVPDTAPYVEPFFTDSLGSELFGQSRVMEPETYDDDAEYYAGLHAHRSTAPEGEDEGTGDAGSRFRRRRPAFLDKVSDSLNKRLGTDRRRQDAIGGPADEAAVEEDTAVKAGAVEAGAVETTATDEETDSPREGHDAVGPRAEAPPAEPPASAPPSGQGPPAEEAAPASSRRRADRAIAGMAAGRQPEAADKPSTPLSLQSDMDVVEASPAHDTEDSFGVVSRSAAASASAAASPSGPEAAVSPASSPTAGAPATPAGGLDGEEVVDDPPAEPVDEALFAAQSPAARAPLPEAGDSASAPGAASGSFTGLISPTAENAPPDDSAPGSPAVGAVAPPVAGDTDFPDQRPGKGRWFAAIGLAVVVLIAAVLVFTGLDTRDGDEASQASTEDDAEDSSDGEDTTGTAEDDSAGQDGDGGAAPAPEVSEISRTVPDSPDLLAERDSGLSNITDDDASTSWNTFTFATAEFGGFASNLVLIMELEESTAVSSVTIDHAGGANGGSFDVLANDSPSSDGAETVGSGTFDNAEISVDLDEADESQYLMINITELPQQNSPVDPNLPYSLDLNDISLD